MDDWLMQRKIKEAEHMAHLRDLENREEREKELANERHPTSYKEWMRLQTMKKR